MKTQWLQWILSLTCSIGLGLSLSACGEEKVGDDPPGEVECEHDSQCPDEQKCMDNVCTDENTPPNQQECTTNLQCPAQENCVNNKCVWADPDAVCGNGIVESGETCDDGEENGQPNKCSTKCSGTTPAECGNGVVEKNENCDDGEDNGKPNHCDSECKGTTPSLCNNGVVEEGEECDDGNESETCNFDCTLASCGDGVLNETAGETCDDGEENGQPNKCNETCDGTTEAVCGNGILEDGETCDDGEENGQPLQCNATCDGTTEAVCGNGILEDGETCDDGEENGEPLQCNTTCDGITGSECGNGVVEPGEECDDGGESELCNTDCTAAACGDGITNTSAGEVCDDGENNGQPNQCNETCDGTTAAICGNGIVEDGETCDDGPDNGQPNQCNATCDGTTAAVCGNGVQEAGETCDDGPNNGQPNQCNETCDGTTASVCGNGVREAGEICDDGENNGEPLYCNANCSGLTGAECGNGVIEEGEVCDDGGESAECNADCTPAACGDGVVNASAGETCDDGEDNGQPNKCNATCDGTTAAVCGNGIIEDGETCDDGEDNGQPNQCSETCDGTTASVCGNGILEDGETCDDGEDNGQPLQCSATCDGITAAVCGNGVTEDGETCDDGEDNGQPNQCNETCDGTTAAICGNNIVEDGEDCDEGGVDTGTCNADCSAAMCGDGYVNTAAGEACDDGGPSETCDEDCQIIEETEDVTVFRITNAQITAPHLYFSAPFLGCNDVTNSGVAGQLPDGVNGMLSDALTDPSDEDPDLFNMSITLLARPLTQISQAVFDAELRLPKCDLDYDTCTDDPDQPIVFTTATNRGSGACFPPSAYEGSPNYGGQNNPTGPCFKSEPTDVSLSIADIELDLVEASVAAKYVGDPAGKLAEGILIGFLPKSVADNAFIEIDAPIVGGTFAISHFLKGGGGCGGGDDSETFNGEKGWWMYLNFEAEVVDNWVE